MKKLAVILVFVMSTLILSGCYDAFEVAEDVAYSDVEKMAEELGVPNPLESSEESEEGNKITGQVVVGAEEQPVQTQEDDRYIFQGAYALYLVTFEWEEGPNYSEDYYELYFQSGYLYALSISRTDDGEIYDEDEFPYHLDCPIYWWAFIKSPGQCDIAESKHTTDWGLIEHYTAWSMVPTGVEEVSVNNHSYEAWKYEGEYIHFRTDIETGDLRCNLHEFTFFYEINSGLLLRRIETTSFNGECENPVFGDSVETMTLSETNIPLE